MAYTDDADLRSMIEDQLELLKAMIAPNGAVLASPNGHYKAHWVRDGLYVLTGALYAGVGDLTRDLIRAPFGIFYKHRLPHLHRLHPLRVDLDIPVGDPHKILRD